MDDPTPELAELAELLRTVRLTLERDGAGWTITYEQERHPVADLPLDAVAPEVRRAELMAVAAGLEAAVKYPARGVVDEDFRDSAGGLLPRVERASFVRAYEAALAGRGAADGERLAWRELGAGLVVTWVIEDGWRFHYLTRAQVARWDVSAGTLDAAARSHLYHREVPRWDATAVALGDGFDASRALLAADVWYQLDDGDGVPVALPGRDQLLVGAEALAPGAAAAACAAASYPLCPYALRIAGGHLRRAGG